MYTLYEGQHCLKSSKPTSTHIILSLFFFFFFLVVVVVVE